MKPTFFFSSALLLASCAQAATFTVTNTNDSGAGSLRQAIGNSNAAAGADIINFEKVGGVIKLQSALPILGGLEIQGPGATSLKIKREYSSLNSIFFVPVGKTVKISGLRLTDGDSEAGGAIASLGNLTVNRCIFSENHAFSGGGAINNNQGTLLVKNSVFFNNEASGFVQGGDLNGRPKGYGGAINTSGSATMLNTIFLSNNAVIFNGPGISNGGAINNDGTLAVVNCNFISNYATSGGAILNNSQLTVGNSIFTQGAYGSNIVGGVSSQGGNISGDNTGPNNGTTDQIFTGAQLGPLQDNGGGVLSMALLPGSPAINAGNNALLGDPLNVETDERGTGFPRIKGSAVDVGAFEFQTAARFVTGTTVSYGPNSSYTGAQSAPLSGVTLTVRDSEGAFVSRQTVHENGTYRFGLPLGQYTIQAQILHGGDEPTNLSQNPRSFEVSKENLTLAPFKLLAIFGFVRTINSSGADPAPYSGAFVAVKDSNGTLVGVANTDGLGRYSITGLPVGDYLVKATVPGFAFAQQTVTLPTTGETASPAALRSFVGTIKIPSSGAKAGSSAKSG